KSTLAQRYADEHPMVLALDVDTVRAMIGGWLDDPIAAGLAARRLALAMAGEHLGAGHDVLVPQLLGRLDFVLELERLCVDVGADLVEVLLHCDPADATARFERRSRTSSVPSHLDAAALAERDPEPVQLVCDRLSAVAAARPRTRVIASVDGDVDGAYRQLLAVLRVDAIEPVPADRSDVVRLVELRDQAARWLTDRGIRQWGPGEVEAAEVAEQVSAGEWFVTRSEDDGPPVVVAALRLLWADEQVWGPMPPDAAYVHGLVVDRTHAGQGLGATLLRWGQEQALEAGRTVLRLDCVESNPVLRAYYRAAGFSQVGRRDFDGPWHSAVLLEKQLGDRPAAGAG
ncbi:MAG TPA: GNAT family N-acetyltransferase, partial [Actinomycetales bacterium]